VSDHAEAVVHVVDDDPALRTALMRVLRQAGFQVRGYPSAGDFLVAERGEAPGCLLLDLELPGPGGLDLQHALRRSGCFMPIVFISAHHDIPKTVQAIKAGASDFLIKPIDSQTLFAAIETALAALPPEHYADAPATDTSLIALNDREQVVLRGIVAGRLNKQIAAELALSERTIKACRADLMRKFQAHSLADLVRRTTPAWRI
jgi:FixJ family two-component response regulator